MNKSNIYIYIHIHTYINTVSGGFLEQPEILTGKIVDDSVHLQQTNGRTPSRIQQLHNIDAHYKLARI